MVGAKYAPPHLSHRIHMPLLLGLSISQYSMTMIIITIIFICELGNEAISIDEKKESESMNNKNEYFKNYISRISGIQNKFTCEFCGRNLENNEELENHEEMFHIRYKCKQCSYNAFGKKDMKQHENLQHRSLDKVQRNS